MNYYRTLNEGLNKYIERELGEEEEEEILDEGIFDKLEDKLKDKLKDKKDRLVNDRFYYINGILLGNGKEAEKRFWDEINKTDATENQKKSLKETSTTKVVEAHGKDDKGEKTDYTFKVVVQAKSATRDQNKAEKQATKIQKEVSKMKDAPGDALNSKYVFTVETDEGGKVGVKLGGKTLITYPNKDTAKIALENILKSLNG